MAQLNFGDPEPRRRGGNKSIKTFLGIGSLAVAIALGSTFAASINLNSSGPVEFGQGITQTTACDSEIIMTPYSRFINGVPGAFKFSGLKLNQVDTTGQEFPNDPEGCAGKTFLIKLYKEDGEFIETSYTISVSSSGEFSSNDGDLSTDNEGGENGSVALTFDPAEVLASDLYTITIETSVPGDGDGDGGGGTPPQEYPTLEEGPTPGGVVFSYFANGFPCGPTRSQTCHYLELAPANWNGTGADPFFPWATAGNLETAVPGFNLSDVNADSSVGGGLYNTLAIIDQNGTYDASTNRYAAGAANAYRGGGFDNWNLPSKYEAEELSRAYGQLVTRGYDITQEYWNSNQCGPGGAYKIGIDGSFSFYTGGCDGKDGQHPVRPVRAF